MNKQLINTPLSQPVVEQLQAITKQCDALQLAWISGYCWALTQSAPAVGQVATTTGNLSEAAPVSVSIISASQTGNAKKIAQQLHEQLTTLGVPNQHIYSGQYKTKNLVNEQIVIIVTSTQGEGEPPEESITLYKFLFGKKAPDLTKLKFAVLGLGDSSYPNYCQTAKDFDSRLAELGATRIFDRVDADLDYEEDVGKWLGNITNVLQQNVSTVSTLNGSASTSIGLVNSDKVGNLYNKEMPLAATLSVNQKITSRFSSKDVRHLEIDLADSGLTYKAGDALGVWYRNSNQLVEEILQLLQLSGDETISLKQQQYSLCDALTSKVELTRNNKKFVTGYANLLQNEDLVKLCQQTSELQQYIDSTPLVEVIQQYPAQLQAQAFIDLLQPLTPRLYSISSAQDEVNNEVHITVGLVQYEYNKKQRYGGASGFLANQVGEDDIINLYIEPNDNFRLPSDGNAPIIMIGAGTGIAPFRAFIQQRACDCATGANWLFFGNQHFADDFLYQVEWQDYVAQKIITKISLAWSRDQPEKIYVQNKIYQQAAEVWQWIEQGAYIYVCGDAIHMAKDVEQALVRVISEQGKLNKEDAEEYLDSLREQNRYQRDVY